MTANSSLDKLLDEFMDRVNIPHRAEFFFYEDIESATYEILKPCFTLKIYCNAALGERIREALQSNKHVFYSVPSTPGSGWMYWEAKLSFEVSGDPSSPEGLRTRNESIELVWKRMLATLTEAVMGTPDPKPTGKVIHVKFGSN